ncbi:hypothetical protein [Halocatena marina]|uniref:hypothetical protein n=1 Tax=Halocatena marina TaxID=2934937 RepID=UPI0020107C8F|nr:hypothetical protein [Halocatena marina]
MGRNIIENEPLDEYKTGPIQPFMVDISATEIKSVIDFTRSEHETMIWELPKIR